MYLVGNRCDLEDEREISTEQGVDMMKELGLNHHLESSALTGHNISELFETLTKHLYLENSGKLNEFREDNGENEDKGRNSSISFRQDKKGIDLYAPKSKKEKKKGCKCWYVII